MPPLSTVLSITMTQMVSTLARFPQWAWHLGHTPVFQSALYLILTDDMFPLDLLQELVCLLAPDFVCDILRSVQPAGAALPAGGRQHQAGQPQVPVSTAVSVQLDGHEDQLWVLPSGHWLADPDWWLSASPSWALSSSPPSSWSRT